MYVRNAKWIIVLLAVWGEMKLRSATWFNFLWHCSQDSLVINDAEAAYVGAHFTLTLWWWWIQYCKSGGKIRNLLDKTHRLHYLPKCLERQNRIVRIVCAIICIFSKLTKPSKLVLLPSWANVISLSKSGIKGITGGCNLPTDILQRGLKD